MKIYIAILIEIYENGVDDSVNAFTGLSMGKTKEEAIKELNKKYYSKINYLEENAFSYDIQCFCRKIKELKGV